MSVKCLSDGELPTRRKATALAALILHPASYGKRYIERVSLLYPEPYAVRVKEVFLCKKKREYFGRCVR